MARWCVTLVMACAALSWASESHAIEGELTLGLGPAWGDLPTRGEDGQSGFGGLVYGEYQLTRFWGVHAGASYTHHLSIDRDELETQRIGSFWVGGRYNFDVFTYIPFLTFGLTAFRAEPTLADADGNEVDAGARFGFGVDWRRWRHWSFGAETNLHAFLTDLQNYPVYLTLQLRISYHWEL